MAYITQETKKEIKCEMDKLLKPLGFKFSMGIRHHSTLILNIKSGPIDFIKNFNETNLKNFSERFTPVNDYIDVNEYHYEKHFSGKAKETIEKIIDIMNKGNHDNSDIMTDYFDVGWYIDINIGKWEQPYTYTGE